MLEHDMALEMVVSVVWLLPLWILLPGLSWFGNGIHIAMASSNI